MNKEITIECIKNNVKKYQVAERLGITDTTFSRKLRKKLDDKEKNQILEIIFNISKENKKGE